MNVADQGVRESRRRHQVIPRVLVFLTSTNPDTGEQDILLLRGAPDKRLWANTYNGLGGHVEADEDVYAAAQREVREEAGLAPPALTLRGIVHIDTGMDERGAPQPGVMMFVFLGESTERRIRGAPEGRPEWIPCAAVDQYPLVDDLYQLLPRVLSSERVVFGQYRPQADGTMAFRFRPFQEKDYL